ncbi:MAG: transporter substrate-binding domain-containing protein [Duncaniella sp.]|nr:transporter substrate-binding domain-containing protein [Duncaniella sp.]
MARQLPPLNPRLRWILPALLVMAVGIMIMARACSREFPPSRSDFFPASGDTINVAIDYSPMSLYRYDDTLGGFNYDLIRMVGDSLRRPLKFHPVVSLAKATEGLSAGRYDLVVAPTPVTASYRKRYHFTEPVYIDRQVLVTLDTTVTTQLNLAGQHISVVAGSPVADRLANLAREIGESIYVEPDSVNGPEQLFILAATGEIPMAVVDLHTARLMASRYPAIDLSTAVSFNQFQSWIMRPDSLDTAAPAIDSTLRLIKQSPAYTTLLSRYGLE